MEQQQPDWRPSLVRPSLFAFTWHLAVWGGLGLLLWAAFDVAGQSIGRPAVLATLVAMMLVGELRPVVLPGNDPYGVVTSHAFVFAILYQWGLAPAVLAIALSTAVAEVARRKPPWKLSFNVGQYAISIAAVWPVMHAFGFTPTLSNPTDMLVGADIVWMALTWATFFIVNDALVAGVAGDEGIGFREAFFEDFQYYVLTTFTVLALSPAVVLVSIDAWPLLPLFLLPLFAVHKAAQISREKEHQSLHDPLTELPNRKLLAQRLTEALDDAAKEGQHVAILLMDLNRFKEVNDTLGHAVGDRLLAITAQRIRRAVRPGDTVARLGGDEFAVVLPKVADSLAAIEVAGRVRQTLGEPFVVDGSLLDLDISIGVALCPEHGDTVEELLRRADVAMYLAKQDGTGIEVYRAEREDDSSSRLGILGALRRALDAGELVVHYQPMVGISGGNLLGMEALVRWNHPERGLLLPNEFVHIAESSGMMHRLTDQVVDSALEQCAIWRERGLNVPVAVNITLRDLYGTALVESVSTMLERHGVDGSMLHLEISERVLTAEPARISGSLNALADLGVRLSLDDFGTGFASLVMLRRLPVDEIKVDGSFVRRLTSSEDDFTIVRGVVDLAHALGIRVVAEGVENIEVLHQLVDLGCDAAQGWHFGRVMPADEATEWLRVHAATRPTPDATPAPTPPPLRLIRNVE